MMTSERFFLFDEPQTFMWKSMDCPARWISTNWTQCSATCGEGTQRLLVVCKVLGERGQYRTMIPDACAAVPKPPTVRPCFLQLCEKILKPVAVKPEPTIQAQRKVYIQWRKGKKLHFVVGGFAYLLPWTSMVLRCPTRHFPKTHVRWLKDGKPLEVTPYLTVSHAGYVKIQQIRDSDAGTYTCIAGQAQENFILKLIGGKQKLSLPNLWTTDGIKTSPKIHQTSQDGKTKDLSLERYDDIVHHLLNVKELALEDVSSKELLDIVEKNLEEDVVLDSSSPQLLVTDMLRFDEIRRNLSGAVRGLQKDELITQLLHELTKSHRENNESTLQPHQSPTHSVRDPASQKNKQRQSFHTSRPWKGQSPIISQKSFKDHIRNRGEIVDYVGSLILVTGQTRKVEIRCRAQGNPEPVISWLKDGKLLGNSSRVGLMPDGSLRIQAPGETDTGLYTCSATNSLGSVSMSSHLKATDTNCVSSDGEALNTSECSNKTNLHNICHGPDCPHRWQVSTWSSCSVNCGGGIQSRTVSCHGALEGLMVCTGKKPAVTRTCNLQPCVGWVTTAWGPCQGHCVGSRQALQYRHVFCQDKSSARVSHQMCSGQPRPASQRNCTSEACALHWRVGSWTQCTATCGRHGFQSRHVTCVHRRSGKPAREFHCAWKPRPASWQRCNIMSCGRGECQDSTRYCEKVRQLELCPLPQFKSRCCQSCRDT